MEGRRGAKPKELSVQMSSVVTAQFGQVLLGPTLTIGDNESVDKALLYAFTRERGNGSSTIPVKKGRPHELHKSEVCLVFEDGAVPVTRLPLVV